MISGTIVLCTAGAAEANFKWGGGLAISVNDIHYAPNKLFLQTCLARNKDQ